MNYIIPEKIPITVGELLAPLAAYDDGVEDAEPADDVPALKEKIEDLEGQIEGLQEDLDEANNEIRRLKHRLGLPTP